MIDKKVKKINKINVSNKVKKIISIILKKENSDSILSKLPDKIIFMYLDIIIKSSHLNLYVIKTKSEIIGYAILAEKPIYLISEFYSLKFKIFFHLFMKFDILTILNIIISILEIDQIFVQKDKLKHIKENYNLNLLAIKKEQQSKGIGKFFLKEIFKNIKKLKKRGYITCETFSENAVRFYTKKMKFKIIGKKIRFFKKMYILSFKLY